MTQLKISSSQKWLIVKLLLEFTSDDGIDKFLKEFPDCDQDALADDIEDLLKQLKYES